METLYGLAYNLKSMNLEGIDIFIQVVQSGSFTKAAKTLSMPITTVSGKIAALEKKLGITLIHRTTRKLQITNEGKVFFEHALRAMTEMQTAQDLITKNVSDIEGILRITTTVDMGHTLLLPVIKTFLEKNAKVKIELILTNQIVDIISDNIDLAVRAGNLKDSNLKAKLLTSKHAYFYASKNYIKKNGLPKDIHEIESHPFIAYSSFEKHLKITTQTKKATTRIHPCLSANEMGAVKSYLLADMGIGVLPEFTCLNEVNSGDLVKVLPDWHLETFKIYCVYAPQKQKSARLLAFIKHAENYFKS